MSSIRVMCGEDHEITLQPFVWTNEKRETKRQTFFRWQFLTAQMSVFMVFCGPHLPLAFQFVCGPGGGGAANKLEGKWKVSLCLVAPPQAAAEYGINSSFC